MDSKKLVTYYDSDEDEDERTNVPSHRPPAGSKSIVDKVTRKSSSEKSHSHVASQDGVTTNKSTALPATCNIPLPIGQSLNIHKPIPPLPPHIGQSLDILKPIPPLPPLTPATNLEDEWDQFEKLISGSALLATVVEKTDEPQPVLSGAAATSVLATPVSPVLAMPATTAAAAVFGAPISFSMPAAKFGSTISFSMPSAKHSVPLVGALPAAVQHRSGNTDSTFIGPAQSPLASKIGSSVSGLIAPIKLNAVSVGPSTKHSSLPVGSVSITKSSVTAAALAAPLKSGSVSIGAMPVTKHGAGSMGAKPGVKHSSLPTGIIPVTKHNSTSTTITSVLTTINESSVDIKSDSSTAESTTVEECPIIINDIIAEDPDLDEYEVNAYGTIIGKKVKPLPDIPLPEMRAVETHTTDTSDKIVSCEPSNSTASQVITSKDFKENNTSNDVIDINVLCSRVSTAQNNSLLNSATHVAENAVGVGECKVEDAKQRRKASRNIRSQSSDMDVSEESSDAEDGKEKISRVAGKRSGKREVNRISITSSTADDEESYDDDDSDSDTSDDSDDVDGADNDSSEKASSDSDGRDGSSSYDSTSDSEDSEHSHQTHSSDASEKARSTSPKSEMVNIQLSKRPENLKTFNQEASPPPVKSSAKHELSPDVDEEFFSTTELSTKQSKRELSPKLKISSKVQSRSSSKREASPPKHLSSMSLQSGSRQSPDSASGGHHKHSSPCPSNRHSKSTDNSPPHRTSLSSHNKTELSSSLSASHDKPPSLMSLSLYKSSVTEDEKSKGPPPSLMSLSLPKNPQKSSEKTNKSKGDSSGRQEARSKSQERIRNKLLALAQDAALPSSSTARPRSRSKERERKEGRSSLSSAQHHRSSERDDRSSKRSRKSDSPDKEHRGSSKHGSRSRQRSRSRDHRGHKYTSPVDFGRKHHTKSDKRSKHRSRSPKDRRSSKHRRNSPSPDGYSRHEHRERRRSPLIGVGRVGHVKGKGFNFKEQLKAQFVMAAPVVSVASSSTGGGTALTSATGVAEVKEQHSTTFDSTSFMHAHEKKSNLPLLSAMASTMEKVTPQQALIQTMAAMHQKAQEMTGVAVPSYYNPAAVNPLKYAEQIKKRKLLWSKAGKDSNEKEKEENKVQWTTSSFASDDDGKTAAKFRKLMGIKAEDQMLLADNVDISKLTQEQRERQEELFRQLDRDYAFARMTTHTHRGIGLGFASQGTPDVP